MRSWHPREPHDGVTVWGWGVIEHQRVCPVRKEYAISSVQLTFVYIFLLCPFSAALLRFAAVPSDISLAVHRLIEICKSLWHRMNGQLLADCPMPLCVQPLNWSAPVCLPSSLLLPMFALARFCLISTARLCVPPKSLNLSAGWWQFLSCN